MMQLNEQPDERPKWTVKRCSVARSDNGTEDGAVDNSTGLLVVGTYDDGEPFEHEVGPVMSRDSRWDFSKAKFGDGARELLQYFLLGVRFKDQTHRFLPKEFQTLRGKSKIARFEVFPPNKAPDQALVDRTLTVVMVCLKNATTLWIGCDRTYVARTESGLSLVVVGHPPRDRQRQGWDVVPERLRQLPSKAGGGRTGAAVRGVRGRGVAAAVQPEGTDQMTIFHSTKLDGMARRKCIDGRRDRLKKAADRVVVTNSSDEMVEALKVAGSMGLFRPDLEVTVVKIHRAVLIFKKGEAAVAEQIAAIDPPKEKPLGAKALTKMCLLRMRSLIELFRRHNLLVQEGQGTPGRGEQVTVPSEIRSVSAMKEALAYGATIHFLNYRDVANKFEALLAKPELKDEHVSAGWDLMVAEDVMDG